VQSDLNSKSVCLCICSFVQSRQDSLKSIIVTGSRSGNVLALIRIQYLNCQSHCWHDAMLADGSVSGHVFVSVCHKPTF